MLFRVRELVVHETYACSPVNIKLYLEYFRDLNAVTDEINKYIHISEYIYL